MPRNDVVVDSNVICLYGTKAAKSHAPLFVWLNCCGSISISQYLLVEYGRQGAPLVAGLLDKLLREGRYAKIKKSTVDAFKTEDRNYNYTCNVQDIPVARTVFRSFRKILVSMDNNICHDVNNFGLVKGVVPMAFNVISGDFLVPKPGLKCPFDTH
jgi:hypothetical protein